MLPLTIFLLACSSAPGTDLALRLPADAVVLVNNKSTSLTRTPLGPQRLEVVKTVRMHVLGGGRLGSDELHWVEQVTRYAVTFESSTNNVEWRLDSEEPFPELLAGVRPPPPREFWVMTGGEIWVRDLPPLEEEEPDPKAKGKPKPKAEAEVPEEEAPLPDPIEVDVTTLPAYLAGLLQAPREPVKPGHTWSWTTSQKVTGTASASNTVAWEFQRLQGGEAVLVEQLSLQAAMAPASGQFRTTGVKGSGEMRLDLTTGLPTRYNSSFEASLASPSAVGTATMKVDARFRVD